MAWRPWRAHPTPVRASGRRCSCSAPPPALCAAARDRKQQRGELSLPHAGAPVAEGTVDDKAAPVRAAGAGALATSRTRSRGQARERPMKE